MSASEHRNRKKETESVDNVQKNTENNALREKQKKQRKVEMVVSEDNNDFPVGRKMHRHI